ncbi:hypothetical protein D9756_001437 [Leucocoprinus leucothites]|uniref:Uncharacterized protein n=1 Tax=Leucocoprinus leucothites TaxID=201217 RepID=A0A8H5LI30_9AGAR|nr:hypothetical protein D9756_001437 [Leucoagaricus leucothites]
MHPMDDGQSHFLQDEYDYLCYTSDHVHPEGNPQHSAELPEGGFDDYMNRLLTSSPSPPARFGGIYGLNQVPSCQYKQFGPGPDIDPHSDGLSAAIEPMQISNEQATSESRSDNIC